MSQGTFGEQYTFFCLDDNGEPCRVKGGSRLLSAWKNAIVNAPKNAKQLNENGLTSKSTGRKARIPFSGLSLALPRGAKPEPSNAIGR